MVTSETDLAQYEAALRRQEIHLQAMLSNISHSDRAAIDIGIETLKVTLLVNAGAIVAVLAFMGTVWGAPDGQAVVAKIIIGIKPFIYGVALSAVSFAVAYIYQSVMTFVEMEQVQVVLSSGEAYTPVIGKKTIVFLSTSILLMVVMSMTFFILGSFKMITLFSS